MLAEDTPPAAAAAPVAPVADTDNASVRSVDVFSSRAAPAVSDAVRFSVPTPVVSAAAPAVAPAPAPVSSPVIPPGSDPSLLVAVDDSVRPVSSAIAHTPTASANAAAAAEEAARVTKVQRAFITMPVKHMGKVATMPLSTSLPQADAFSQLIRSVRIVLNDILVYCDDSGTTIDSDTYVRGWERPLEKRLLDAVSAGKSATSDLSLTIADFFLQVGRALDQGSSGPDAFKLLLRRLAEQFDQGDSQESFLRLQNFGVSDGTPFSDYLRAFRLLVSSVTGSERVLAPSVGMVLELVRQSVTRQFPTLSPLLYPGTLATDTTPFASIDAMWDAFAPFHTNKTPAMAGSNYFSLPQATGSSKSRRSAPVASKSFGQGAQGSVSSASKPFGSGAQGSSAADPIVLAVSAQGSSSDPFTVDYACWPATHDHWPEVYMVSTSFKTHDDPPLWTALLTQDARNQAFASCRGKCLNCGSPDHSMKTCPNGYINQSGLLNSELAHNPDAFKRWQRRMVSHRRSGNTSGSRSNRHSRGRAPFSGSQRRSSSHNASLSGPSPQSSGTALALHPLQHSAAQASASSGAIVPSTSNTGHN